MSGRIRCNTKVLWVFRAGFSLYDSLYKSSRLATSSSNILIRILESVGCKEAFGKIMAPNLCCFSKVINIPNLEFFTHWLS